MFADTQPNGELANQCVTASCLAHQRKIWTGGDSHEWRHADNYPCNGQPVVGDPFAGIPGAHGDPDPFAEYVNHYGTIPASHPAAVELVEQMAAEARDDMDVCGGPYGCHHLRADHTRKYLANDDACTHLVGSTGQRCPCTGFCEWQPTAHAVAPNVVVVDDLAGFLAQINREALELELANFRETQRVAAKLAARGDQLDLFDVATTDLVEPGMNGVLF